MQARDIMTWGIEKINADSTAREAAQKMETLNIGCLPIEQGNKIIGILTDRDLVTRLLAQSGDPGSTKVKELMSKKVICCDENDSAEQLAQMMEENKVRRLIVCDHRQNPVGIVSLGDMVCRTHEDELAGEILEAVSAPGGPTR